MPHLEFSAFTPRALLMFFLSADGHICLLLSYRKSKRKSLIHIHFISANSQFCLFPKALSFNKRPFLTFFFFVVVCLFSSYLPGTCLLFPQIVAYLMRCFLVQTPGASRWLLIGPILVQMFTPEEPTLLCEGGSFKAQAIVDLVCS